MLYNIYHNIYYRVYYRILYYCIMIYDLLTVNFSPPSLNLSSLEFMKAELVNVTSHFSIAESCSTDLLIDV